MLFVSASWFYFFVFTQNVTVNCLQYLLTAVPRHSLLIRPVLHHLVLRLEEKKWDNCTYIFCETIDWKIKLQYQLYVQSQCVLAIKTLNCYQLLTKYKQNFGKWVWFLVQNCDNNSLVVLELFNIKTSLLHTMQGNNTNPFPLE